MGIFKSKLNEAEQSFLDACSDALTEIKSLDVEMLVNPIVVTAENIVKSGNNFSTLVTSNRNQILNFSIHNKKFLTEIKSIGSEIRSIRDKAIHFLDLTDLHALIEAKKPSIEWERIVIQRILQIAPISFFHGDKGFRGNVITEMLTGKEWETLRAEYAEAGSINIKGWESIRETCRHRYEELNVNWPFGDGVEYL